METGAHTKPGGSSSTRLRSFCVNRCLVVYTQEHPLHGSYTVTGLHIQSFRDVTVRIRHSGLRVLLHFGVGSGPGQRRRLPLLATTLVFTYMIPSLLCGCRSASEPFAGAGGVARSLRKSYASLRFANVRASRNVISSGPLADRVVLVRVAGVVPVSVIASAALLALAGDSR